jgi:hypothetical protein
MRTTVFTFCLLGLAGIAGAQEGHPIKGSWIGVWEGNEAHGENVLVILDWDGERISGIINPGTDNIAITSASLNPSDWLVTIDAESADGSARYRIEGNIQDLELPNRSITGTWRSSAGRGNFEIRRQ